MGSHNGSERLLKNTSPLVTVAACILIRTSLSLGKGTLISLRLRWSGDPYFIATIPFIYEFKLLAFCLPAAKPAVLLFPDAELKFGPGQIVRSIDLLLKR